MSDLTQAEEYTNTPDKDALDTLNKTINESLKTHKVVGLQKIDDSTFLRRAYLKIIGRIPSKQEARSFLENEHSNKRQKLINELVNSDGYVSHTFNYWADLLRLMTNREASGLGWHLWLRDSIVKNKPYDQFVAEMLTADGHTTENPAVGYFLRDKGMLLDNVSNTVQVFLGQQIGCAQCHDHPFEDLSQREYYEFAAFFGGIAYHSKEGNKKVDDVTKVKFGDVGKSQKNRKQKRETRKELSKVLRTLHFNTIEEYDNKPLRLPHDYKYSDGKPGEVVKPGTFFGKNTAAENNAERRDHLRKWLVSPENPYFTKNIANRIWAHVFGKGLIHPIDNLTEDSETAHPEVLNTLEELVRKKNYNLREILRTLYSTHLFQAIATGDTEEGIAHVFKGPILTRLSAEQLYDSLLVLKQGEITETENPELIKKWDTYQRETAQLRETGPKGLLESAKTINEVERKSRKLRSEAKDLRIRAKNLVNEGNRKKAKGLYIEARKLIQDAKNLRENQQMISMTPMAMKSKMAAELRASEQPAPFPGRHLVRRFGGSDRTTPSSSRTDASIPQALTMLNGEFASLSQNTDTHFRGKLNDIKDPTEKIEHLFLSIYATRPNSEEIESYTDVVHNKKNQEALIRAMLSSNRFLFIQ